MIPKSHRAERQGRLSRVSFFLNFHPWPFLKMLRTGCLALILAMIIPAATVFSQNSHDLTSEERAWLDSNRDKLALDVNAERPPLEFTDVAADKTATTDPPPVGREQSWRRWMVPGDKNGMTPGTRNILVLAGSLGLIVLSALLAVSYVLRQRLKEKVMSLNQARKELLDQKERLSLALSATNAGVWDYHPKSGMISFSPQFYTMLGQDTGPPEMNLEKWSREIHPDDIEQARNALDSYVEGGGRGELETEFRLKNAEGSWFWVLVKGRTVAWDSQGQPSRIIGLDLNIQNIKEVQEELVRSESRFRAIFDNAPYPIAINSLESGFYLDVNRAFLESRDIPKGKLETMVSKDFLVEDPEKVKVILDELVSKGSVKNKEALIRNPDGSFKHLIYSSVLLELQGQTCVLSMTVDVTDLKEAEKALVESEARFRSLFQMAPVALAEATLDGRIIAANERACELSGYTPETTPTIEDWWHQAYPDPEYRTWAINTWLRSIKDAMDGGKPVDAGKYRVTCKDGQVKTVVIGSSLIGGRIIISFDDVTQREAEELARLESLEVLRSTLNTTPDGVLVVNQQRRIIQANDRFFQMWGIPETMRSVDDDRVLLEYVRAQLKEPDMFLEQVSALYHSDRDDFGEILLADGRVFERHSSPLVVKGEKNGRVWDFRDVTERLQAENERQELQEQLHQALKLEAVGILAGGVAHDFNNMLGVIIGYTGMILNTMDSKDPLRENLGKVLDAAERSANLTRQLLAFARKQTVAPVTFDLNESVAHMLRMLHRVIGENIELVWRPSPADCTVHMDPSQLDQLLTNLCVNARDAVTDVGRVTITTSALSLDDVTCRITPDGLPGDYVLLSVSDSGCGMDPETLKHVFEPFFTTKKAGQGTGLGLATVYGVVKQNGGFVHIDTEPGLGTTFNVYLPRHKEKEGEAPAETFEIDFPMGCGETILVVEDDPTLRQMGEMMVSRLGYNVLVAATPGEAIRLVEEQADDLRMFITDVVMPEMNGRELADRLVAIRPSLRHLFMSGYTADVIAHRGVLDEGVNFIQKPFSLKDLAVKIRTVLDQGGMKQ